VVSTIGASKLLRTGVLEGVSVLVAGPSGGSPDEVLGAAVCAACAMLGAKISRIRPEATEETALDAAVEAAMGEMGGVDLLVVDGAGLFGEGLARSGEGYGAEDGDGYAVGGGQAVGDGYTVGGGHAALRACMDAAWNATRAVVNGAFLPAERGTRPRRIVYLAPARDADRSEIGQHAGAARAGLENLARTLSIEWARHGITAVTIAPGAETPAGEVAALTAYIASPAGAYFSGCLLDLRGL
jgi:NAD(P)-dependent dehydrogenase (short-subunit alcohol dehydrogenase family)